MKEEPTASCRAGGFLEDPYHIDAAYGGFAVLDPGTQQLLKGLELSDSVTLDPHKWLFQPYETGCLMARDAAWLAVHRYGLAAGAGA